MLSRGATVVTFPSIVEGKAPFLYEEGFGVLMVPTAGEDGAL